MPYDPFAYLRPQLGAQPLPDLNAPPTLPPLSQAEQDSMLSRVGNHFLGGMGYVGGLLDKYTGGRAVRGLLGGHPRELASLLPFSDALGVTDEQDAVSGKQLLQNAGVLDTNDDSWMGTLGGMAAEMALNPTTYMTLGGGALTNAGELAAKIGAKAPSFAEGLTGLSALTPAATANAAKVGINTADVLNQPLHGLASIHLPFTSPSSGLMLGAGQGGADLLSSVAQGARAASNYTGASKVLDPLYNNVVEPAVRYGRSLFDPSVRSATSRLGQEIAPGMVAGVDAGMERLKGNFAPLVRSAEEGGMLDDGLPLRAAAEGTLVGPQTPEMQALAPRINDALAAQRAEYRHTGFLSPDLAETDPVTGQEILHSARHQTFPDKSGGLQYTAARQKQLPMDQAALSGRQEILTNFPGGTTGINEASLNPKISGVEGRLPPGQLPNEAQRAAILRGEHLGFTPQMEQDVAQLLPQQAALKSKAELSKAAEAAAALPASKAAQGIPLTAADQALLQDAAAKALSPAEKQQLELLGRYNQSFAQADFFGKMDPAHADQKIPFFGNHPILDAEATGKSMVTKTEAGKATQDMLTRSAVPYDQAGPGAQRLSSDMLAQMGFTDSTTATQRMMEQLTAAGKIGGAVGTPQSLTDLAIPADVLKDATRFIQGHTIPDGLKPLAQALDAVTNLTKSWQTTPWPGFNVRNLMSGQFMNWVKDAGDANYGALDPRRVLKPIQAAQQIIRGGEVEGAAALPVFKGQGLSDAEATKKIADLAYQYRVLAPGGTSMGSGSLGAASGEALAKKIPGVDPFEGYGPAIRGMVPHSLEEAKPWAVAGVGPYNTDVNSLIKGGREISSSIDDTNRLSAFWGRLTQGYEPGAAATDVRAMHVDYEKLTPFEREVMRRVIPFYSYHRGIVPAVLQELAENPGGAAGQLAMQTHNLRSENTNQFVPEYMGGGLALALGKEQDGTQRFLSRLDTPIEAALDPIGSSPQDTLMGILGQSNPLIKGPLEYATGKQFFTGRDMADLYPMTGSSLADQALMNSPASRAATTVRQLLDPRKDLLTKALNVGTGVKLTDVDMEKQRDLAARELISQELRGQPGVGRFESFYARPGQQQQVTPENVAMLRLQQALDQKAKERAKTQRIGVRQ